MSQTTITDIGTVGIPVSDQDKAVEFFTGTLGFEKRLDVRMGESFPTQACDVARKGPIKSATTRTPSARTLPAECSRQPGD